jgi:acetyltransferase AlgX (SGNH hydrolase-like protein)
MEKILHFKYIFIAVLFFMIPLLMWPFKSPSQKFELRKFSSMPEFTLSSIKSRKYYHQLGDYLTDRFPFKNEMTAIRGHILVHLFSSSPNERVRVGSNNYYYFTRGIELPCGTFDEQDIPAYWGNIEQFITKAKEQGIAVRIAFAPQKQSIYPEFMSTYDFKRYKCAITNLDQFLGAQPIVTRDHFIALWDKFNIEKEKYPNKLLHHPTDTHWNEYGASFFSEQIINSLSANLWSDSDVYLKEYSHQGDLGRIMGLPLYENSAHVIVKRNGVSVSKGKRTKAGNNYIHFFSAEADANQLLLGKVVIIHDSFGKRTFSQLPPYFRETIYIHHEAVGSKKAAEVIEGAKYIIVTFSERFMYTAMKKLTASGKIYRQFFSNTDE